MSLYAIGAVLFALAFAGVVGWGEHFFAGLLLGGLWAVWTLAWSERHK